MHLRLYRILINPYFLISSLILTWAFTSCTTKEVEFKSLKDIKVVSLKEGKLVVEGTATFYNPNRIGITLKESHIDVLVNGKEAGTLKPLDKTRIKKLSTFQIPIVLNIDLGKASGGGNIFNLILKREVELSMVGFIKISKFLIPSKIPVNFDYKLEF